MSTFFADTSALAKRYLKETGSAWVLNWIEPPAGNITVIAQTAEVEMFSLFMRRQRDKTLSARRSAILQADFLFHAEKEYLVTPIDSALLTRARLLVTMYPLRALDALQLASALQAVLILNEAITFISADKNLLSAATAEGFTVDDPNAHP